MTPGKVNLGENALEPQAAKNENETHGDDVKKAFVAVGCDTVHAVDKNETNPMGAKTKSFDDKLKLETMEEELLGSLTSMSSPAVRTSARVIQKMKMDSIRPTTPPPIDKRDTAKDEHHRTAQKTPNQSRPSKTIWSNVDRNLFFDALNEYGKDFESIANYINGKQKRKNATDPTYKAKEHVRLLYYQTFTKISKYLRFSDDVAKKVQELYALINYGEMRKKIPVDNQKFYMKLRELVYRGSVTWRVKGKNCRIKTPSCPTLRKINQVEKWQEDIKLPAKVDVEIRPADNESWYAVQSLAQNPRVKTSLPLQKRLISVIKTLQSKWKSREAKMREQQNPHPTSKSTLHVASLTSAAPAQALSSSYSVENIAINEQSSQNQIQTHQPLPYLESLLCIAPSLDATIHRPYVNLTDFLNSYSICLNSYEERIDATVRGESLCAEHITNFKETVKSNTKRQRHDSGSEKKSPDTKRTKAAENDVKSFEHDVLKKSATSTSQDGMSTASTDDLIGVHDDRDFSSPTYENAMFELDGVGHIESLSADEADREDAIKFKTEQNSDDFVSSSCDVKKEPNDLSDSVRFECSKNEMRSTSSDQLSDCVKRTLASSKTSKKNENKAHLNMGKKRNDIKTNNREAFRPLINEEVIQKIRKGWTVDNVGDITIGDLYIMFGQDSKVRLEYKWVAHVQQVDSKTDITKVSQKSDSIEVAEEENVMQSTASATTGEDCVDAKPFRNDVKPKNVLSNKLKQLLMLAGMTEKTKRRTSCACGHSCDRGFNKIKKDEVLPRSFISNKTYPSSINDSALFRQPVLPSRTGLPHFESYRLNLNASRNKQNRWAKSRNNRVSKQVVVQRLLPLQPGIQQPYEMRVLSTPDVGYSNSTTVENSVAKSNEFNSTLTTENLNLLNSLSGSVGSNAAVMDKNANNKEVRNASTSDISKLLILDDDDVDYNKEVLPNPQLVNKTDDKPTETDEAIESDEEENIRIRQKLNEDPGIQSLMEISLPSPIPIASSSDEYYADSQNPVSPMGILRESPVPAEAKWFEENMHDFSLSSFLGQLESCEQATNRRSRSPGRCIDSSNLSTISETSIDYMSRFEELTESMKNEANNMLMQ